MPIYEFECEECKRIEESPQKIDDPAPECHHKPMKRLISGAPSIRKGAGLYSLDIGSSSSSDNLGDWKE